MRKICIIFIAVILALGSVSAGNAEVLFQDDFNDGNYDGWTHIESVNGTLYPGDWTVTLEGRLQCTPSGDAQNLRLDLPTLPESYVLEFDTRTLVDGDGASLIGWYTHFTDWNNQLAHGYRPGRIYINETLNGAHLLNKFCENGFCQSNADPTLWHHIKYVKDGTSVTLYFDTQLVLSVDIPVGLTGGYLVLAGARFPGIHQFDNVLITTIEPSPTLEELAERVELLEGQMETLLEHYESLQERVENHSHTYMTGEGAGHNNTEASTSPPIAPGE